MKIFLSYASEDHKLADDVHLSISGLGHQVFFDRDSLPPGGDYHDRIRKAVESSDVFVFLISAHSLKPGSYTLTELKYARSKWSHPKDKVVPVFLHKVEWEQIPAFLKAATVLDPEGNIAAETAAAVSEISEQSSQPEAIRRFDSKEEKADSGGKSRRRYKASVPLRFAVIGIVAILGAGAIFNWGNLFPNAKQTVLNTSESPPIEFRELEKLRSRSDELAADLRRTISSSETDLLQINGSFEAYMGAKQSEYHRTIRNLMDIEEFCSKGGEPLRSRQPRLERFREGLSLSWSQIIEDANFTSSLDLMEGAEIDEAALQRAKHDATALLQRFESKNFYRDLAIELLFNRWNDLDTGQRATALDEFLEYSERS